MCFSPGGIPGCEGVILTKGSEISAIIRRHLRGRWRPSVEYVNVNVFDLPGFPPTYGSQETALAVDTDPSCPFLTVLRLLLKRSHWSIFLSVLACVPVLGLIAHLHDHLITLVCRKPELLAFPPTWPVPAPNRPFCVELSGPSAFDSPVESGSSLHRELVCRCSPGRGSVAWLPSPERRKSEVMVGGEIAQVEKPNHSLPTWGRCGSRLAAKPAMVWNRVGANRSLCKQLGLLGLRNESDSSCSKTKFS